MSDTIRLEVIAAEIKHHDEALKALYREREDAWVEGWDVEGIDQETMATASGVSRSLVARMLTARGCKRETKGKGIRR